ncbi:type VII secretion integral membrane protein EccD [Allokutzneria albata]|uniref:Type VII secretion integral membrane protein EccD n=1 Tax=Allokutzneria albata TaxID=211114 RepID=A0A1G9WAW1_ALLAB|nr:type VII secretion integral membrane protein EccD [Allokutzneria albata]SDM81437.1 type VII secretion integral membrane protein EccD [Allokutzneria albata]
MTSATSAQLCRITVSGPSGRADLAVPVSTTVAALLPTLVRHVVREEPDEYGSWALQRLGEAPMDPDGTPETLDWLDGEQFHVVRAEDPLPELDFDDIADGMATAVNRQGNRWNETVNRRLFLGLTVLVFGAIGAVLFEGSSATISSVSAASLAAVLFTTAVLVARILRDRGIAAISGLAGCVFAGLAGLIGVEGVPFVLGPVGVLIGGIAMAGTASLLLVAQRILAPELPIVPFGVAAVAGLGAVMAMWLHLGVGLTPHQNATIVLTTFLMVTLFAPKLATRAARLRGPQLPRTADELQIDVEPEPAALVVEQTGHADRYLSVLAIGASLVFAVAFRFLIVEPGWVEYTVTGLLTALVLLRSREFLNIGQRIALVLAGTTGAVSFVLSMLAWFTPVWRGVGLVLLLGVALLLVLAALRPSHRRLLPIWAHLANVLETCAAVALVPFLLQVLGIFAWARGLAG